MEYKYCDKECWNSGRSNRQHLNFGSGATIKVGQDARITIGIPENNVDNWSFQHGVSVEVRLLSAAGQEYPKTVTLP